MKEKKYMVFISRPNQDKLIVKRDTLQQAINLVDKDLTVADIKKYECVGKVIYRVNDKSIIKEV